ncbi:hypothetical protein JAAARDRAFT_77603 [Jaapia argillacea MUCL 33604]|uniref:Ras-GEF domain-containing protein n=1 Tax=Jaapia argillacea MUCL 33604 TaxID=933084 RepID=A0A067QA92_9AGAM|nr:hypothetical protein JAAARDRAFT_77603 [Jaapia argillacea MUCL 33604]
MTDKALPEIPETTSPVVSNEPPRELRINFELDGRTVVAGTVEDSIRFLVSTRHDIFRTLFIQSFPLFTTAPELFSLFDRLLESSSGGRRIGIRALRQDWLHVLDASDIAQIRSSPQSHTGTARSPFSEEVEVFMASRSQPSPTFSRSSLGSGKVSRPSSDSLAAALTTLEAELFSRVTYVDCMTYLRDSPSTVPSNIREILETRIKIKDWVIITVLQARDASSGTESSSARAAMYRFFVQIALRCHKIGNFSSAFAIAGALHSHYFNSLPITRPQARWRSDGQKRLEELYTLAAYRKALEKWNGPCIPVLDTYLREWTTSFKPSHIQKVDDEGFSWVDYRRCAEIRSAMGSILRYRHHLPNVRGGHDPDTMHYLDSRLNRNWETIDLDKMGKAYEEKEHEEDKHRSVGYPSKPR